MLRRRLRDLTKNTPRVRVNVVKVVLLKKYKEMIKMMRQIDLRWHLRVSLLPECNLRCRYCNPEGNFEDSETLNSQEILDIVKAAVANGIVRVHWTGGEPCLTDIVSILESSKKLGMKEQIMTTNNGTLQVDRVHEMKQAGLNRVNISLDSLNPSKNKEITGRNLFSNTVKWIESACNIFDEVTKMNIVPMRDNINEIEEFIKFAQRFNGKLLLKFIELCPNNPAFYNTDIQRYHVSRQEIVGELEKIGTLKKTTAVGDNPNAEYYQVGDIGVTIIFVTMPSQNYKCGLEKCRKMRISPFGIAGSCIQQKGKQLKGISLEQKIQTIGQLIDLRNSYSDVAPVARRHFRGELGFWRFGKIKKEVS